MISLRKKILILFMLSILFLTGCSTNYNNNVSYKINITKTYNLTEKPLVNPYIGLVSDATNISTAGDNSLVRIDITFSELQPTSSDHFAFAEIDAKNNVEYWRSQGKHAVLRFICDRPSSETHSDLPQWLMNLTNDGTYYDTSLGKGYSPNYGNDTLIKQHQAAIDALAKHYDDGFLAYVEVGSIGHNGEWQVKSTEGVNNMPLKDIRQHYISHYVQSFKNAKLLMSEPFSHAKNYNTGLFNLNLGSVTETDAWLNHIEHGGAFALTEEENELVSMQYYWKTSPSGAIIPGSVTHKDALIDNFDKTREHLKKSHASYIGNVPYVEQFSSSIDSIRATIGYRIGISKINVTQPTNYEHITFNITWENIGIAPLYFDMPVALFVQSEDGEFEKIADVNIKLSELAPNDKIISKTYVSEQVLEGHDAIYVGILDSNTGNAIVKPVSDQPTIGSFAEIYRFETAE